MNVYYRRYIMNLSFNILIIQMKIIILLVNKIMLKYYNFSLAILNANPSLHMGAKIARQITIIEVVRCQPVCGCGWNRQ